MKSIKYILLAIAVISISSCGNIRKISIGKVEYQGIQLKSFTSAIVDIGIEVTNPTKKAILLTDIEGQVCKGGSQIAVFNLENEIVVEPGHTGFITIPLDARLVSLSALSDLPIERILDNDLNTDFLKSIDIAVPAKIIGRFGGVRKTKRFANLLDYMR